MNGIEIMKQFLPSSPFVAQTGIELTTIEDGYAELTLPFRSEVVTIGEMVHGGAIATLIDCAAMAAAWAGAEVPENLRGSTVGLTVTYLAPANAVDLVARARVLRRGKSLTNVDVEVVDPSGQQVAKALVTYKLG